MPFNVISKPENERVRLLQLFLLLLLMLIVCGCDQPNRVEMLKYKRIIIEDRNKKNESFKFAQDSPIPDNRRWEFKELNYFPVNISYKIDALFRKIDSTKELEIQTSSGHSRTYVTVGILSFDVNDKELKLMAYQEKAWLENGNHNTMFVPFTDETSGKSTYGGGRYLDLPLPGVNQVESQVYLDFNLAYNPYCVYNHNYSCPIPPPENHLPVEIRAGEKSL